MGNCRTLDSDYGKPCSVQGYIKSPGSFGNARVSQVQALSRLRPLKRFVWAHWLQMRLSRQVLVSDGFPRVRIFKEPKLAFLMSDKCCHATRTSNCRHMATPVARANQSPPRSCTGTVRSFGRRERSIDCSYIIPCTSGVESFSHKICNHFTRLAS